MFLTSICLESQKSKMRCLWQFISIFKLKLPNIYSLVFLQQCLNGKFANFGAVSDGEQNLVVKTHVSTLIMIHKYNKSQFFRLLQT